MYISVMEEAIAGAENQRLTARSPRCRCAFTLVELLVVIGIIALLVGLLLPALSAARRVAQRTQCAAKIHQQLLAAAIHVEEHHGYYPLVGVVPGVQPQNLQDPDSNKYDYFSYPFSYLTRPLAPITYALAQAMSRTYLLGPQTNEGSGVDETDPHGFIRYFLCPSQASSVSDLTQFPMLWYFYPDPGNPALGRYIFCDNEAMSYVYNEAILGWGGYLEPLVRCKAKASLVRQSSSTMFVSDGLGGKLTNPQTPGRFPYPMSYPMATIYNLVPNPPITLADALLNDGKAGDPENFDINRHRGKINIGFFDGHVETRNITPIDLASVFLLAP
jgi:prepilin-type processing-associated H-X9-DG protein/prepilin-type N-terminal cleavage/methylation domain-containing protein